MTDYVRIEFYSDDGYDPPAVSTQKLVEKWVPPYGGAWYIVTEDEDGRRSRITFDWEEAASRSSEILRAEFGN